MTTKTLIKAVSYDAKSFILNGKRELLVGGEFHYFRTPSGLWEDRLIKMKRSGANLITTYIPWNWHEQREGAQLWDGDRDLKAFIELCIKHGLYMIVKPGPYCCAEMDFGGHPDWLLGKNVRLRELDDGYLDYVRAWYASVAEEINPYLITNGGNIFCIQVENEYDHLIAYGDNPITVEDATEYFFKLEKMMCDYGIDIPKFANEAEFLRGHGIIDTRTYYTNIPFFRDWMWFNKHFDEKIINARAGQPDCPTMILELQVGWFAQHGGKQYMPDLNLTEAVAKSVLMEGASVLNFYMYVGGTTFPFWGSRGNIMGVGLRENDHFIGSEWDGLFHYDLEAKGIGLTSSFDFGGSPIREWGELHPERYYWIKAFNMFTQDFSTLLLESEDVSSKGPIKVVSGGEGIKIIGKDKVTSDTAISNFETENFSLLVRENNGQYLVCVRNLINEVRTLDIEDTENGERIFKDLKVAPYGSTILPVNVKIEHTDITIISSTSELLFSRQGKSRVYFGVYGKKDQAGIIILDIANSEVDVIQGEIQIEGDDSKTILKYSHDDVQIVKAGKHILFIVEQHLAGKIEVLNDGVLISDAYYIRDIIDSEEGVELSAELKRNEAGSYTYIGDNTLMSVTDNNKKVNVSLGSNGISRFKIDGDASNPVKIQWVDEWKVRGDIAECTPDFNDSDWRVLEKPVPMENAGLFEHGYVWYRGEFDLPKDFSQTTITYYGNDTDRQYIYLNGRLIWGGISKKVHLEIDEVAKAGRNVIAVLYQNFFHNKSHPHEGRILKFSGIMKPIKIGGTANGKKLNIAIEKLSVREQLSGLLEGCVAPEFDDSGWMKVDEGHKYVLDEKLGELMWMRRKFKISAPDGVKFALKIKIPKAENRCFIYVNGRAVGWFESVGPQHDFYVPETFLQEENTIVLLVDGHKGFVCEPQLGTFYESRKADIKIQYAK